MRGGLRNVAMFAVVVMLASVAAIGQISYPAANDINAVAGTGTMG